MTQVIKNKIKVGDNLTEVIQDLEKKKLSTKGKRTLEEMKRVNEFLRSAGLEVRLVIK